MTGLRARPKLEANAPNGARRALGACARGRLFKQHRGRFGNYVRGCAQPSRSDAGGFGSLWEAMASNTGARRRPVQTHGEQNLFGRALCATRFDALRGRRWSQTDVKRQPCPSKLTAIPLGFRA